MNQCIKDHTLNDVVDHKKLQKAGTMMNRRTKCLFKNGPWGSVGNEVFKGSGLPALVWIKVGPRLGGVYCAYPLETESYLGWGCRDGGYWHRIVGWCGCVSFGRWHGVWFSGVLVGGHADGRQEDIITDPLVTKCISSTSTLSHIGVLTRYILCP